MALTKLEFYNLCLSKLGSGVRVASLTENTSQRLALEAAYTPTVHAVLRTKQWNCAERRVVLDDLDATVPSSDVTALGTLPDLRSDWAYRYLYPSDCLELGEVCPEGSRRVQTGARFPFEIGVLWGSLLDTRVIYTDLQDAEAIYTADISTHPTVWDPLFTQAAAYAIATEIAFTMTGKPEMVDAMRRGYLTALSQAAAASFNEGLPAKQAEGSMISERF